MARDTGFSCFRRLARGRQPAPAQRRGIDIHARGTLGIGCGDYRTGAFFLTPYPATR